MKIRSALEKLSRKDYKEESSPVHENILDCNLGVNSFGTSDKVLECAKQFNWSDLNLPPDNSYKQLKKEIMRFWSDYADIKLENIKIANGSSVVLSRINKIFIESGVRVLGYIPQFTEFMMEVAVLGGYYEGIPLTPEENLKFNPDILLRAMKKDHFLVYIDNPNNPTGQLINICDIEIVVKEASKKDITIIVDEAYGDYVMEKYSAINLINKYKNLIVTRTFTKGYGIGFTRVGYAILSTELSGCYSKIELPFPVSSFGAELAREALSDHEFVVNLRNKVRAVKGTLINELMKLGYTISETHKSCPIFIINHKDNHTDFKELLQGKGIITKPGTDFEGLDKNYVRINTPASAIDFLNRFQT